MAGISQTSLALVALFAASQGAWSQQTALPPAGSTMLPNGPLAAQAEPTIASIEFAGGTIAEYIQMVREQAGKGVDVNVAVNDSVAKIRIGAISLRNIDVFSACSLLTSMTKDEQGSSAVAVQGRSGDRPTVITISPVERVTFAEPRIERRTIAKDLSTLLSPGRNVGTDDILAVAKLAAEQVRDEWAGNERATLVFHPQTNVLLATGTKLELDAITSALEQFATFRPALKLNEPATSTFRSGDADVLKKVERALRSAFSNDLAQKKMQLFDNKLGEITMSCEDGSVDAVDAIIRFVTSEERQLLENAEAEARQIERGASQRQIAMLEAELQDQRARTNALIEQYEQRIAAIEAKK